MLLSWLMPVKLVHIGGVSPNRRKFRRKDYQPLFQCQIRHNCIKINGLVTVTEDILIVKVNIAPSRRGDYLLSQKPLKYFDPCR